MSTYMSAEVSSGVEAARKASLKKATRIRVRAGSESLPVLNMRDGGFTTEAGMARRLRGLVDIYEGRNHLYQALIVACEQEGDTLHYEFKRATRAEIHAAADHVRRGPIIAGLLSEA